MRWGAILLLLAGCAPTAEVDWPRYLEALAMSDNVAWGYIDAEAAERKFLAKSPAEQAEAIEWAYAEVLAKPAGVLTAHAQICGADTKPFQEEFRLFVRQIEDRYVASILHWYDAYYRHALNAARIPEKGECEFRLEDFEQYRRLLFEPVLPDEQPTVVPRWGPPD